MKAEPRVHKQSQRVMPSLVAYWRQAEIRLGPRQCKFSTCSSKFALAFDSVSARYTNRQGRGSGFPRLFKPHGKLGKTLLSPTDAEAAQPSPESNEGELGKPRGAGADTTRRRIKKMLAKGLKFA